MATPLAPPALAGTAQVQQLWDQLLTMLALATASLGQYHRKLHLLLPRSTPAPTLIPPAPTARLSPQTTPNYATSQRTSMAHKRAKSRWRSFNNHKPARHVRRVFKRKGKGKGKGKGWSRTASTFRANLSDADLGETFAGFGKWQGKWKGKFRTSGMGSGREGNPTGPDGAKLKCHECDSEENLVRDCPRRRSQSGRAFFLNSFSQSSPPSSSPLTLLGQQGLPGPFHQQPL